MKNTKKILIGTLLFFLFCIGVAAQMWGPAPKRIEIYSGTTDGSGQFTVTFAIPFSAVPHIDPVLFPSADSTTRARIVSASTTGFTVQSERNSGINVVGSDVLGLGTAVVPNVPIRVAVTAQ